MVRLFIFSILSAAVAIFSKSVLDKYLYRRVLREGEIIIDYPKDDKHLLYRYKGHNIYSSVMGEEIIYYTDSSFIVFEESAFIQCNVLDNLKLTIDLLIQDCGVSKN